MSAGDVILLVLSLILPPLPVALKRGICSADFLINLILCLIGFVPGLVHAWYIVLKYPEVPHVTRRRVDAESAQRHSVRERYSPLVAAHGDVPEGNMTGVYGTMEGSQDARHGHKMVLVKGYGSGHAESGSGDVAPPAYTHVVGEPASKVVIR